MNSTAIRSILIAMLFLASCSDSFFNELPTDQLSEDIFFTKANDFEVVINDGYLRLRDVYDKSYLIGDVASDIAYTQKSSNNFAYINVNESNVDASNTVISGIWTGSYRVISRANLVLDRLAGITLEEGIRKRLEGEAKFLRSLVYFNLIRIFGDVPLVLKDVETPQEAFEYGRHPIAEIYNKLIEDLMQAEDLLPDVYTQSEHIGRATSMAAKSLLGHIYLTRGQYNEAAEKLAEVVNSEYHSLLPDYSDVFDPDNANNKEVIFAVQYARGMDPFQGNPLVTAAWPNESVGSGIVRLGSGFFLMTEDIVNDFEPGDLRREMNNYDFETGYSHRYVFTKKYWDNNMIAKIDAGNDWIIYRYADIVLQYAEALNELGRTTEAWDYLDQVRKRAHLTTDQTLKNNQSELRLALEKERKIELNCEGHRWFDLVRTGRLLTVMNAHFQNKEYDAEQVGTNSSIATHEELFPLPFFEVNLSNGNISQNTGY